MDETCLAAPWQRFSAAVTDVFVLLLFHIAIELFTLANSAQEIQNLPAIGMVLAWLYLWLGALCGATPGKWLWHLRVVHEDGSRLTPQSAMLRCFGYALAILPLKAGLLPILTDKQRRGWHDSLAHTRVVKRGELSFRPIEAPEDETKIALIEARTLPLPDLKVPWRHCGWVLLFYTLMALIFTWPLALHFTTHLAGYEGDNMVFAWNYWWFHEALQHGQSVTATRLFFYPEEISLLFHTMNFFNCALAFPLQEKIGLVSTYNLLTLFTFIACPFAAYWLLCSLTRDHLASAIVGLCFGFSSYFTGHSVGGHANLLSAQFVALFALFFYSALTLRRFAYGLLAGIMLALSALCDWQYLLFDFLLAACLFAGVEIVHFKNAMGTKNEIWRRVFLMGSALSIGTMLLMPLLLPMIQERKNVASPFYSKEEFHIDPLDLFKIGSFNSVFPDALNSHRPGVESLISPGLLVLSLAALTLWKSQKQRHKLMPWLVTAGVSVVLACGFHLRVAGFEQFNSLALLLLGGPPGSAFDLPWHNHLLAVALELVGAPFSALQTADTVALPLGWLLPYVPFLKVFRVPSRFGLLFILCTAVVAAFGLSAIRQRLQQRGYRQGWPVVIAVFFLLAEYGIWPFPMAPAVPSEFYRELGRQTDSFALVPLPLEPHTARMAIHELNQTVHHKPLVAAYVSRAPRNGLRFFNRNQLLLFLNLCSRQIGTPKATDYPPEKFQADLSALRAIKVRYIVIHKRYLQPANLACVRTVLTNLKLPVVWRDNEIEAYQISGEIKK